MIAQDVLLGRPLARTRETTLQATDEGGRAARWILGTLLVSVIVFEAATVDPLLTFGTYLHRGIGSWTGLPIIFSPLEVLLILGVLVSLGSAALGASSLRAKAIRLPMGLFVLALIFGFARGFVGGGDSYIAMWEVRYLLYVPACFFIVRTALRTREHVAHLLRVGLLATLLFATEGAWRKIALVNTGALGTVPEFYYEHEDVIFLASFLVLLVAAFLYKASARLRVFSALASPVLLYTLLSSGRRSGVIVLLVGLLLLGLTVIVLRPKAFLASVVPVLLVAGAYIGLFWNASGIVGQPARAIRSLYEPDARDAASNIYRVIETYDISLTIHDDPLLGVGFGREFNMTATLADLSWWPFWRYETHNNVLWMWMKTGGAGYLAFWILVGSAISRAAFAAKRFRDQELRAAGIFCLVSIVGVIVFAYVDLGLVSGRVMVFFGTVLGLISVVDALGRASSADLRVRT